jgi:small-conductance mechanosensitive channel
METTWLRVARADLIKAFIGLLVLVAGVIVAKQGNIQRDDFGVRDWVPAAIGTGMALVGGIYAVRAVAKSVRKLSADNLGDARGAGLSLLVTTVGYLLVLITVLSAIGVNPAGLLLGGAITGVVIGIAAQQTLSNFFAGIVLLVNRPLVVGQHVVMKSGPLGGEYEGLVTDMSLFYVKVETAQGPVALPNAAVLASAIGPGARTPKDEKEDEAAEDQA